MSDAETHYGAAEAVAFDGLSPEQAASARPLVRQIVDDWLRQASEDRSLRPETLVRIGLADLRKAIAGRQGDQRLTNLRYLALKPQVQRTSGRAFELAKRVADGKTSRRDASAEAGQLQRSIQALFQAVRALPDDADQKRLLMRDLADADLECRYVIEEKEGAISFRLNRHING